MRLFFALLIAFSLSACGSMPVADQLLGPQLQRDDWDKPSEVFKDLVNLPKPRGKIVASVYSFRDLTGQYKQAPASTFSTAVSQGAASILLKASRDSGWFSLVEREGLQDLLTERKIIRAAMKNQNPSADVTPLLGANVLFEGGIIGYETNMKTGGVGAKYFGIGGSEQYRVDQVTVNLRVVDVNSGRVINSVTTSRSILSRAIQGGVFRFVRFKRLLEMEGGYTRNEPVQLCLTEAIQDAIMRVIVEGVEDKSWSLADAQQMTHPLMFKYGRRVEAEKVAKNGDNKDSIPADQSVAKNKIKNKHMQGKNKSALKGNVGKKRREKPLKPVAMIKPAPQIKAQTVSVAGKVNPVKNNKPITKKLNQDVEADKLVQQPQEYAIQLISSSSSTEIFKFIDKNKLSRKMIKYIHYLVKGKPHFAVLYGKFKNKQRALHAIESLPPELRIYEPWIRALESKS